MKWHDLQHQPSIIDTRLFVYGRSVPVLKGDHHDAHINGFVKIVDEAEKPATLHETKNWSDEVQGTLYTRLTEKEFNKAKEFYGDKFRLITVPVTCKSVRIQAPIFIA